MKVSRKHTAAGRLFFKKKEKDVLFTATVAESGSNNPKGNQSRPRSRTVKGEQTPQMLHREPFSEHMQTV